MVSSVILNVEMVSMEMVPSAGKIAQIPSPILEDIVLSHLPMEEVLVTLYGIRRNAIISILKVARNGELCGTLNVEKASITLDAVSVLLTVLLVLLISVSHAKRALMVEVLENHLVVHLI